MSIQAVAWVLEHSTATLAERLVLIAIANHADARGVNAYPSVPLIAREARVSEATVYRALGALENSGEVTVRRRAGRSNMYALAALYPSQIETPNPSQSDRGNPSQIERAPLSSTRKRGRNVRPEPSVTVKEPSRAHAGARPAMPPELPADVKAKGAEFFRALRTGQAE